MRTTWALSPLLLLVGISAGCGPQQWTPSILENQRPPLPSSDRPFLKAHLHSGELVVFSSWRVPGEGEDVLEGVGTRFSVGREVGQNGQISLPLDSVALLESNRRETVDRFAFSGLTVYTGLTVLVTAACVSDPKSCFGSCPTFYVNEEESDRLVAEGFSSSVARMLEDHDLDALPTPVSGGEDYSLLMRNEAPETHAVRWLHLLAVPRPRDGFVYATPEGRFLEGSEVYEPSTCRGESLPGTIPCLDLLRHSDGREYYRPSDSLDLATREVVELEFPDPRSAEGLGLLIRGRASLLSTFLFYQSLAYVGEDVGRWLAALERGDAELADRVMGLPRAIGSVEVLLEQGEGWEKVGTFGEAGPIASDEQVIPLPAGVAGPLRVRLRMARGAWRIDRVGLVRLGSEVEARVLHPNAVKTVFGGVSGEVALSRLLDPDKYLVTQQGDAFEVRFRLPGDRRDMALFLDSRGYYYEWMREEWAREKNPGMVTLILSNPEEALRRMAADFKARESRMEETFWASRFRRNQP
jgi:hypothetical protein